ETVKPARSTSRSRARKAEPAPVEEQTPPVAPPQAQAEDEGFAAGIVDTVPAETPAPEVRETRRTERAESPRAEVSDPVAPAPTPAAAPVAPARVDPNEHGFDAETNSRYEAIKKGNTYISELQHMTIAQLQKTAREAGVPREEYNGLKKQDLVYRILRELSEANGLMFGEGTLEVLPDGFGF